jgi:MoxR-like ATPase
VPLIEGGPSTGVPSTGVPSTEGERTQDPTVGGLIAALEGGGYLADRGLATAVHLAGRLERPLLLEGEAGVGKTELAKVLAVVRGAELVRLQCHEGLDRSQALYAWDHPRQLLHLRALEASGERPADREADLYDERFLLERPLLRALRAGAGAVLLVDEIDRADDEFEAFLLELLSDFQVSVPELGTVTATAAPTVLLTSNRTRELSDALKRRCLYHWIDHPSVQREIDIVRLRAAEVPVPIVRRVAGMVARLRELGLYKPPGVAETIDWARALAAQDGAELDRATLLDTLGVVVKDHDDLLAVRDVVDELLAS